jgi:hypothetical protein
MSIDYESLLRSPKVRLALGKRQFAKAAEDEDFLPNLISEEEKKIFTLSNDYGANFVTEWQGLFFAKSTEYAESGPYESLDEALGDERFWLEITEPEIDSEVVPLPKLKKMAKAVASDGEAVFINGTRYVLTGDNLVEEER